MWLNLQDSVLLYQVSSYNRSIMQVSISPFTIPPAHPGAFAPKCVPRPKAFAWAKENFRGSGL